MVDPEILPNYAFFETLSSKQLKAIAKIAHEILYDEGVLIFKEGEYADGLFIMVKGGIELFFSVEVLSYPELHKELPFGTIYPGELFGISSLVEPYILTASARSTKSSVVIKIDGVGLIDLCQKDEKLAYALIQQVARTSMERLGAARLQLATVISTTGK
jgi:CRP/FNR family transcriptional regulator, cyclic AMP receptor protein